MPKNPMLASLLLALALVLLACSPAPADESDEAATETPTTDVNAYAGPPSPVPSPYPSTSIESASPAVPVDDPTADSSPAPYPPAGEPPTPVPVATSASSSLPGTEVYLPVAAGSPPTPTAEPTALPEAEPTVDFAAVRAELEAQGQQLASVKTGFHVTLPEDREILDDWMERLDAAGVPVFIKTVDNAEPLFKAQELMRESGVPHVLVFRATGSVPNYELPPQQAAQIHWETHRDLFPPELDPNLVWIETLNEPDRTRSEWLAQFALETARLAMADGFRWAAFGWASGEPEEEHWRGPYMQEFLRLAGENPDRLAIAVHEYSYIEEDIGHEYPFKIGRFQALFQVADELGIPRPTVLITEWGWEHADIPPVEEAMEDIKWVSKLYAAYPQVKGAAIWNLGIGCCFGDISEQVQELITPLTEFSLRKYYAVSPQPQPVNPAQFQP